MVSPAKSRAQQAVAQAQYSSLNKPKSPAGSLLHNQLNNPRFSKPQRQNLDIHKLEMNTPHGFCPCVSKTEFKFVTDKFDKIVKQREKENEKDLKRQFEADLDIERIHNSQIPEPVPNGNHTYCQVCNENYENYLDHVKRYETHQVRAKIQEGPFSEID
jgi:hypothetical protein